jgi:hypothetical protein
MSCRRSAQLIRLVLSLPQGVARLIRTTDPDPPPALVTAVAQGAAVDGRYEFRCSHPEAIILRDWLRTHAETIRLTDPVTATLLTDAAEQVAAVIANEQAHERLLSGALPYSAITRTLASIGDGTQRCAVCEEPIVGPVQLRVYFLDGPPQHFHGRCHHAWVQQRESIRGEDGW